MICECCINSPGLIIQHQESLLIKSLIWAIMPQENPLKIYGFSSCLTCQIQTNHIVKWKFDLSEGLYNAITSIDKLNIHHSGKCLIPLQTPSSHPLVGVNRYMILAALEQRKLQKAQVLYPFLCTLMLQVGNLRLLGPFQLTSIKYKKEKD